EVPAAAREVESYERPRPIPYPMTPGEGRYAAHDFFATTLGDLIKLVVRVVETESPVHQLDVLTRIAGMWDSRLGSRIQAGSLQACDSAVNGGVIKRRDEFYWSVSCGGKCAIRSRAGIRIPGDRIAPEEYQEAILAVLSKGHAFSRANLVTEVRSVFGFNR